MSKISDTKEKHSEVLVRKGTIEHELVQTRKAINHEQSSVNSAAKKRDNFQNSLRKHSLPVYVLTLNFTWKLSV